MGGIDPNIILRLQQPQFERPRIQTPLEQFQKILTLKQLMQEGQLGELALRSKQEELDAYKGMGSLFPKADLTTATPAIGLQPPAAAQPVSPDAYQEPNLMRPAGPEGRTPVTTTAFAPAGTAPAATTGFAPAGIPSVSSGLFGGPSDEALIAKGGRFAFPLIEKRNQARKAQLDQHISALDLEKKESEATARLVNGITDDESLKKGLAILANKGKITWDDARRYSDMGFANPVTQTRLKKVQLESLDYSQQVENALKNAKAQQEQTKFDQEQQDKKTAELSRMAGAGLIKDQVTYDKLLPRLDATTRSTMPADFKAGVEALKTLGLTREQQETTAHQKRVEELQAQGQTNTQANQIANQEAQLRDDFTSLTKPYRDVRDSYSRIQSTMKGPRSGASDIALVFNYMKMLDPGSTVMKSEQADASNAGNVPDTVRALWNRMLTGERLPENVRQDFLANAERIYGGMGADYEKLKDQFTQIARRRKVDERNIVFDFTSTAGKPTEPEKPKYETIERTSETPGGRTTGTITIAPPGKIKVSKDGQDFWLDSEKWPQAQKRGYTRAE